jgi:hypothetical protein
MRPSVKQPYYYIINITDPSGSKGGKENTDQVKNNVFKETGEEKRYGNSVTPIM